LGDFKLFRNAHAILLDGEVLFGGRLGEVEFVLIARDFHRMQPIGRSRYGSREQGQ
jgi:hypothetical protein